MLIQFRQRNFRSFREDTILSLVAAHDRTRGTDNALATRYKAVPLLLKTAAVYGPNAGGKSNLLRGLQLMRGVVVESAGLQPGQIFNLQPFRLDAESRAEPTLFEVDVLIDDVRYQYGFELNASKIISEWLFVYETSKPQRWFERELDIETGSYRFEFGGSLAGPKRTWQEATRDNALFLSTAVQLNSESLRPLHDWFAHSLVVLLDGGQLPHEFSTRAIQSESRRKAVVGFMGAADIGIAAIAPKATKGRTSRFTVNIETGQTTANSEEAEILVPEFIHRNGDLEVAFGLEDESQGTQKLYALSGPILEILENGSVLVVDELDRSLHPLLCRQIIQAFHDPLQNPKGAQLIFTTHDTSLLETVGFRRDQIWFAEKGTDQASRLVPLSDFSPRSREAIEKGYLSGRYGGVPILGSALSAPQSADG